jgi:hypothetical protein
MKSIVNYLFVTVYSLITGLAFALLIMSIITTLLMTWVLTAMFIPELAPLVGFVSWLFGLCLVIYVACWALGGIIDMDKLLGHKRR